jgi:crotonobetainyl-CoA:carnitine CoA-transferase CaiB-like acyl-CoA transferase
VPAVEPVPSNVHTILSDPWYRRTGRVAEEAHPDKGKVREFAVLVRVSDADIAPHRLAPELGQHTDEILRQVGYDDETIADLRGRGAIR